jgi:hypothetical protein
MGGGGFAGKGGFGGGVGGGIPRTGGAMSVPRMGGAAGGGFAGKPGFGGGVTGAVPRPGGIAPGGVGAPAVAGGGAWRGRYGAAYPGYGRWRGRHHRNFYPYAAYPFALGGLYGSSYLYDDDYYYGDYCRIELRRFVDRHGRVYRRRVQVCT